MHRPLASRPLASPIGILSLLLVVACGDARPADLSHRSQDRPSRSRPDEPTIALDPTTQQSFNESVAAFSARLHPDQRTAFVKALRATTNDVLEEVLSPDGGPVDETTARVRREVAARLNGRTVAEALREGTPSIEAMQQRIEGRDAALRQQSLPRQIRALRDALETMPSGRHRDQIQQQLDRLLEEQARP